MHKRTPPPDDLLAELDQRGWARVPVLLPYPFTAPLHYAAPPEMALAPGDIVSVSLRKRQSLGVVWDLDAGPAPAGMAVKPVSARVDAPPLPADLRRFITWLAAYTLAPLGEVLAMALRVQNFARKAATPALRLAGDPPGDARPTPTRGRVLALMADGAARTLADIAAQAGVSPDVVRRLASGGVLVPAVLPHQAGPPPNPDHAQPSLAPAQAEAAAALIASVRARAFGVTLLEGVTGSGKTEVYLEAVAEALRLGRQALVLLPEIALTTQSLARFTARFGCPPSVWHSDLTPRTRALTWRAVADGSARIVVGARSALFLPFADLGLVVIDEEHEPAFKQEEGVIYHGRDMGVVRARAAQAPCVLASATPSLETLANVESGRYAHLRLPDRYGGAAMPAVAVIDLRETPAPRGRFLSPPLVAAVAETLARGEQAMLFLNRRGYAPLTLCRACGHRLPCPQCSAWLVEHRARAILTCHHCGHTESVPQICPSCGAQGTLAAIGPGVERITEEAQALFPQARLLVMASDTLPGPQAAAQAALRIEQRAIDLIIGTQIVAKGWHFPHLTLVGVVDADLGLASADLRGAERAVQLLHQVAGRAGRAEFPGRVLLQSFLPEHPVMQALVAGDIGAFIAAEQAARRPGHWPPYGRLVALIVSSGDVLAAERTARDLGLAAPRESGVEVLGPAPAPLSLLRGKHRRRLLLKARREVSVQPLLRAWLSRVAVPAGVRVEVDVDPVSFL